MPTTTDRKGLINQYLEQVSLTPVDCLYENFKEFSPSNKDFNPADLNSTNSYREDTIKTMYYFFKKMIDVSNANLIRNVTIWLESQQN